METSSKRNEHPGCSCWACKRGKHTPAGHFTTNQTQRKLRRLTKQHLARGGEDTIIVSTPYTD